MESQNPNASHPPRNAWEVSASAPAATGPEPNTLGIIAFIFAIIGFCLPVLSSLPAFIMGVLALFRPRRGFAIAAVVLSFTQLALAAILAFWIVTFIIPSGQIIETMVLAERDLERSLDREAEGGHRTLTADAPAKIGGSDAWGTAWRVEVIEENGVRAVFLWSAGADAQFDTPDDFVAASDPADALETYDKPLPTLPGGARMWNFRHRSEGVVEYRFDEQ
ncbi:MAG: hypothetical protein ACO31E_00670 [Phycisphaerales bacterium]